MNIANRFRLSIRYEGEMISSGQKIFCAIAGSAFVGLAGCGNQDNFTGSPAESGKMVTIDLSGSIDTKPEVSSPPLDAPNDVQNLNTGEFKLQISGGKVNLYANQASRVAIVKSLAEQIGFSMDDSTAGDAVVTFELKDTGLPGLIDQILTGERYHTKYAPKANSDGFRLRELSVGFMPLENSGGAETANTDLNDNAERLFKLPPVKDEIYLGNGLDELDLVQRLSDELPQNRADAISELVVTPVGVETAYQVYMRDQSPDVRLAVLDLLGTEDLFLAKQLMLTALQDPHPELVMAALSLIESSGDYSLVPQVESLANHSSMEVRDYAQVVRDSLTAVFFTPEEYAENGLLSENDTQTQIEENLAPGDHSQ